MTSTRLFVGNINYDARERDVEKFFKGYGRIREITLKNGFGFVVSEHFVEIDWTSRGTASELGSCGYPLQEFEDSRDAGDAVREMNGQDLMDQRWEISHHIFTRSAGSFVVGLSCPNFLFFFSFFLFFLCPCVFVFCSLSLFFSVLARLLEKVMTEREKKYQ